MSGPSHLSPGQVSCGFADAITNGDVDGALAFWADDAVMIAPDGTETRGRAALRERFVDLVALGARLEIAVADVTLTDDGARATTTMHLAVGPGGDASVMTTQALVTYARTGAVLRILRDEIVSATS